MVVFPWWLCFGGREWKNCWKGQSAIRLLTLFHIKVSIWEKLFASPFPCIYRCIYSFLFKGKYFKQQKFEAPSILQMMSPSQKFKPNLRARATTLTSLPFIIAVVSYVQHTNKASISNLLNNTKITYRTQEYTDNSNGCVLSISEGQKILNIRLPKLLPL